FKDELAQLKGSTTPPPPPSDGKPWRPLFDGKTKESLLRGDAPGWKFENGAVVSIAGVNDAAQTRETFGNAEIRFRFEAESLDRLWFNFRQGAGVGYNVSLDSNLKAMDGKHELLITAQGDKVTATLDGKPTPVVVLGVAATGWLQFNGTGKRFAVLSVDVIP